MKRRTGRRTDFGRWRAGGYWFGREGRSLPTTRLEVGVPDSFRFVHGMRLEASRARGGPRTDIGTVNAIWHPSGMVWVTP